MKVTFNNKNENPFTGLKFCLELFQNAPKGLVNKPLLEKAWKECDSKDKKEMFYSLCFSIGDITNRQHNLFDGKRDGGGYACREAFRDEILPFLVELNYYPDLMHLTTEYTTMDNILATRVRTKKNTKIITQYINQVSVFGYEKVAQYCAKIYNQGTEFQKLCLAKYLTLPKSGKKKETKNLSTLRRLLLKEFCDSVNLKYEEKEKYTDFTEYRAWRKKYNKSFESVLFSTQSVFNLDKETFFKIINQMPSQARFRTRKRLLTSKDEVKSEKYESLAKWYLEWEKYKENKQEEQRKLEEKVLSGEATEDDKVRLNKVKKQGKVTTGAINFQQLALEIISGRVDKVKVQPFLDKINLPYNTLVFADDSGSMSAKYRDFTAFDFAAFMATICLTKNPDIEARNMIGLFSNNCRILTGKVKSNKRVNSILNTGTTEAVTLLDHEAHFLDNFNNMRGILSYYRQGLLTNVSSIFTSMKRWIKQDPAALDHLQRYPVWTLISDGNFNNLGNATASINELMNLMENKIGFKPYIILMDVTRDTSQKITNFIGIDNLMMVPPNPANIEMFLTNFKDLDSYDVYTPLQSIHRSNRYAEVREMIKEADEGKKDKVIKQPLVFSN